MNEASMMRKILIAALLGSVAIPSISLAQVPGVAALIEQGRYWRSKGRHDLANQAYRRALALDPSSAEARRGLNSAESRPASRPTPRSAPSSAGAQPAAQPGRAASPNRPTPAPGPRDTGGDARAAGFRALDRNDLTQAATQFERALARNRSDADALGGLGITRLRQDRFGEARDLLAEASRRGIASKWADALATSRFYADLGDARAALSDGRLADAQTKAETLVRSGYTDRQQALELLATIYERQGRYADAADIYRQAAAGGAAGGESELRLKSRAARGRALAAITRGDEVTAEQEFQSGLLLDQNDPWIRYEYARFMIGRGRVSDADALIRSLSASSNPDALYAAALIKSSLNQPSAAEALIDRVPDVQRTAQMRNFAVGLKTDQAIQRARDIAALGRQAEARATLQQLSSTPGLPAVKQAAIADVLYDLGDIDGAAMLAQQAMSGDIADVEGYEPIVRVLAKTGRDDLAASALQRASQMAGGSADGQRALARINGGMAAAQADRLRLAQQYAPAFDLLQSAWNAAPGNRELLSALARLYQSGGMPARAAQTYQLILAQSPGDHDALLALIETAGAAGDTTLARQAVDRAIQQMPNDHQVYMAAARMEQARGDEGAAVRYLKRAREIYARQMGSEAGILTAGNPFGTASLGGNPFRSQAAASIPAPVNPFALGGGSRLPAYAAPAGLQTQPGPVAAPVSQFGGAPFAAPPGVSQSGPVGDPVMARLESDIRSLTGQSGPRADVETGYRQRSGEKGLSSLKELTGSAAISTGVGNGRISAKAEAIVLDAEAPAASGAARFGGNAISEAAAIVGQVDARNAAVGAQHASGVALSASYKSPLIQLEAGTTPLGIGDTKAVWYAAVTPRFSSVASGKIWFERQSVKDSVVSYAGARNPATDAQLVQAASVTVAQAGARDPVTGQRLLDVPGLFGPYGMGERWGQVMRTGGGLSFSYDRDGTGFYGDGSFHRYRGDNVRRNWGYQLNAGGYVRLYRGDNSSLTGGINVNYQDFDNNQNFFTYGHGGYFSPQSFLSVSFPFRYAYDGNRWEVRGNFAPGYQSYDQEAANLYPTSDAAQALLNQLKLVNGDVRSTYDGISKTGFALSADGAIYYRVSTSMRVGGQMGINTFGNYDEFRSLIGIRQSLGGGQ